MVAVGLILVAAGGLIIMTSGVATVVGAGLALQADNSQNIPNVIKKRLVIMAQQ